MYIIYDSVGDWRMANDIVLADKKFTGDKTNNYASETLCKHPTENKWYFPLIDLSLETIDKLPKGTQVNELSNDWTNNNEL